MKDSKKTERSSFYRGDCEFTAFLRDKAAGRVEGQPMQTKDSLNYIAQASKVKLFVLDVDGVLTDGSITYTHTGDEVKTFNCRDGFGLNILQKIGVEVALITARKSGALTRRAEDISIKHVFQGIRNKVKVFNELIENVGVTYDETAYMGDDWLDLSLLSRVGFAATVADGDSEVKKYAHYIASKNGGCGAVREVCDLIIDAKGKRQELLNEYLNRK